MSNSNFDPFYLQGPKESILLLHGLTGSPDNMRGLGTFLHSKGYTVYAPLMKGHGHSFNTLLKTTVFDWYDSVKDAIKFLKEKDDRFSVMGLSMGGSLAVRVAEEYDVKCLVTFNAPLLCVDLHADVARFNKNNSDPKIRKQFLRYRTVYSDFVHDTGQTVNLKKITCPVMINQGLLDADRYKLSSMMLESNTSSKKVIRYDYQQSGHMVLHEGEEEMVYQNVLDFLENR